MHHDPVLLTETLSLLQPQPGETVVDVTLGLGGHSLAFTEAIGHGGKLIGVDTDYENLREAKQRLSKASCEVVCVHANFRDLAKLNLSPVNIVFADLGLSSPHLDDAARGFTFRQDGPLDLRFNRDAGMPARSWLAQRSEQELTVVLRTYGELADARRLARVMLERKPQTTVELLEVIRSVVGFRAARIAPQVFQALRIAVNDELGALQSLLQTGLALLSPGGRMAIVSYHSLEDRLVKQMFRDATEDQCDELTGAVLRHSSFVLLTRKAITPSKEEVARNPRSRSAKLRAIGRRSAAEISS